MENLKLVWKDIIALLNNMSLCYIFGLVVLFYDIVGCFNGTSDLGDILTTILVTLMLLTVDFFWYDKLRSFSENKP